MKDSFKYIVIIIIVCLSLVFLWQLYWLMGLYESIKIETTNNVISCIEKADIRELQIRLDSLDRTPKKGNSITFATSFSNEQNETTEREETLSKKVIVDQDTTITTTTKKKKMDHAILEELVANLKFALHQTLDSIAPYNLYRIDSLLALSFQEKDIKAQIYYTEVINLNSDKVLKSTQTDSLINIKAQSFILKYDFENNIAYKVYTEPLTKTIIMQMSSILFSTVAIILLLAFAFWYLIKTVMRQKTLEEMKDDFTNNMTHELKTPIAVAYSAADALLNFKQGEDKEKREKYLTICKDQLSTLSGRVEQILSMSMERRNTFVLDKEDITIKENISILIDQHKLKSDKDITFNINITPEDLMIKADRSHLNNMVSNLIENAIKYSDANPIIDIKIYNENKYHVIEISDNGIGISAERQNYIFDKFYRVPQGNKHDVKGYGLGLFYVKTMAEKHKGSISVSSNESKGSTFTIKIPMEA